MIMNITKTLCKYLDSNNTGYVTIGDIIGNLFMLVTTLSIILLLLYCIFRGIIDLTSIALGTFNESILTSFETFSGAIGILIIILSAIIVTIVVGVSILNIKVVKCEIDTIENDDNFKEWERTE